MGLDWTLANELVAVQTEILHESYRVALASGGVKKHSLPRPLRIPRPQARTESTQPRPLVKHASTVEEVVAVLKAGHRRVSHGADR